jgi:SAM-dependent methyltransferase
MHPGQDLNFNAEEKFPLEDKSFDHAMTMNVLEHIWDTHNVFSEVNRILKPGGKFISTVPYMHHVHGSPDDYNRYTESAYRKYAAKYGFEVVEIKSLGDGLLSFVYQCIGGWLYFNFFKTFAKWLFTTFDKFFSIIPQYKKLAKNIPLGYFWIMVKKSGWRLGIIIRQLENLTSH